jgi:hypothetical protein
MAQPLSTKKKIIRIIVCAIFLLCGIGYYFDKIYTGLASDEEMIAHFKEHRAEIEELVKRYREFEVAPNNETFDKARGMWAEQSDTRKLMYKEDIEAVTAVMGDVQLEHLHILWLPNPYTLETANLLKAINNLKNEEEKQSMLKKYGMVRVYLNGKKYSREYKIYKHFVFIPEAPRIENGMLLGPFNTDGEYYFKKPLFSSLNHIPFKVWKYMDTGEGVPCILKQIETQWFLRLCVYDF